MGEKNNIPQIRFKKFEDNWKKLELFQIVDLRSGRDYKHLTSGNIPVYGTGGYMLSVNKALSYNEDAIGIGRKGTIDKPYILKAPFWTVDTLFYAVPRNHHSLDFIHAIFQNINWKHKDESTGVPSLSKVAINNITTYSTSINEQSKIGTYFQNLDKLITLQQQKHDKLVTLKKAMLDKMFPKEGADVPEIRFKGFTKVWEEKKIAELGDVVTGSTPSTQEPLYYSNIGIPWVTPTDILDNITYHTAKYLSVKGQRVSRLVPKNTILVTSIASIGKNTILGTLGSFNQQINGLIPDEKICDSYFLFTESVLWSNKMKRSAASGTMQIVNKTEFSELKTFIPTIAEQIEIGSYFQNLDKLISLHQQEIQKLKNMKKACLEKMFV